MFVSFSMPSSRPKQNIYCRSNSSVIVMLTIKFSIILKIKRTLKLKVRFCFCPFVFVFCYSRLNIKQKLLTCQNLNGTLMQSKCPAIQNIFTNVLNKKGNLFSWEAKQISSYQLYQNKAIFGRFMGLTTLHKNESHTHLFFRS